MSSFSRTGFFFICIICIFVAHGALFACDKYAVHQELFFTGNGFLDDGVVSIAEGPGEKVFVGLKDKGVVLFENGKIKKIGAENFSSASNSETSQRVKAMVIDIEGQLWVATAGGLYVLNPNDLRELREFHADDRAFSDNIIQAVTENNGEIVIGTTRGLALQGSGNWRFYTEKDGLPSDLVNSVAATPKGLLLAGTSNGLAKKMPGNFQSCGLNGHWVNSVKPNQPAELADGGSFKKVIKETLKSLLDKLKAAIPDREDVKREIVKPEEFEGVLKAITELLSFLGPDDDKEEFFAASNQGVFLVDLKKDSCSQIMNGWSLCLALDSAGNLFAGQKDLQVKPYISIPNFVETLEIQDLIREQAKKILLKQNASASSFLKIEQESVSTNQNESEKKPLDPTDILEKRLKAAEITALYIDRHGIMWVGTSNVGLFKFQPITVNAELPINILKILNAQKSPDETDTSQFEYYRVSSKQPKIDIEVMSLITEAVSKWAQPGEFTFWTGRWSQLTNEDREMFLDILAKNGDPYHLKKYVPLFFYDSYVVLPIGPGEVSKDQKVKTLKP